MRVSGESRAYFVWSCLYAPMLDLPNWCTFGYTSKKGTPYIFCSRMIFLYTDAFVDLAFIIQQALI